MIKLAFCDDDCTVLSELRELLALYRAQKNWEIDDDTFHIPLDLGTSSTASAPLCAYRQIFVATFFYSLCLSVLSAETVDRTFYCYSVVRGYNDAGFC